MADDGDRRAVELRENDVVTADEGEIPRQLEITLGDRSDGAGSHLVRADDDRSRRIRGVEELGHGHLAGLGGELPHLDDAVGLREAPGSELRLKPGSTLSGRTHRRAENEIDAPVSEVEQMADCCPYTRLVVVEHAPGPDEGGHVAIDQDARHIEPCKQGGRSRMALAGQ